MTTPSSVTKLIDFALHPPLGLLSPFLDEWGPYSGNLTLTRFQHTQSGVPGIHPVADSYGVLVTVNGPIAPGRGFHQGWVSEDGQYEQSPFTLALAQLVVQHQFLSGAWITTQEDWITTFPWIMFWQTSLPGRIGLLTAPDVSVDLYYLRTGLP